jgi:hypothetical protein
MLKSYCPGAHSTLVTLDVSILFSVDVFHIEYDLYIVFSSQKSDSMDIGYTGVLIESQA